MLTLNKKTILISVIVFVVIALVILNVFLFLNWQTKQKEAQRQAKAAADIQVVQNLISLKKFDLLKPEIVKTQGWEPEAVKLAEQVIVPTSEKTLQIQVDDILKGYRVDNPLGTAKTDEQLASALAALSPNIVSQLASMSNQPDLRIKYQAILALALLAKKSELRAQVLPVLKEKLADSTITIRAQAANILIYWGQKEGIPVMIEGLDSKYQNEYMTSEPPLPLPEYSQLTLISHTEEDFGFDQVKWQVWWQENQEKLIWNAQSSLFYVAK